MVLGQPRVTSLSPFLPPKRGGRGMTQNEKRKRQNDKNERDISRLRRTKNSETEQNVDRALAARSGEIPVHPHPMSSPER
jgi:hypothetical protein